MSRKSGIHKTSVRINGMLAGALSDCWPWEEDRKDWQDRRRGYQAVWWDRPPISQLPEYRGDIEALQQSLDWMRAHKDHVKHTEEYDEEHNGVIRHECWEVCDTCGKSRLKYFRVICNSSKGESDKCRC